MVIKSGGWILIASHWLSNVARAVGPLKTSCNMKESCTSLTERMSLLFYWDLSMSLPLWQAASRFLCDLSNLWCRLDGCCSCQNISNALLSWQNAHTCHKASYLLGQKAWWMLVVLSGETSDLSKHWLKLYDILVILNIKALPFWRMCSFLFYQLSS